MSAYRRWLPLTLLLLGALALGLYPAAHAPVQAIQRGDEAAAQTRYSAALAAYAQAATRAPGCPHPHLRQAAVYLAQQRYEEARAATLSAIHVAGLSDPAARSLARLYLAQESPAYAVETLNARLARRPRQGEAWQLLGEAHLALGEDDQAQVALETALTHDLSAAQRQAAHEQLALLCLDQERGCARAHLGAAARGPDPVLAEQATILEEALRPLTEATALEDLALAHAQLGRVLLERDDLQRSRSQFEAALALYPTYADAHAYLGHVWSLLGQPAHAEQHLRQAIALEPDNTLPRYFLGMHYLRRGWLETGRDTLVVAYELEPGNPALCAAIADSYLRGETPWYEVAEQWLLAAVDNAPDDARFHLLLAHLYVERGLDPGGRGLAAAQAAVKLAPEDAEAHETLGWAYHLAGRSTQAVESLERARALAPSARVHYRLGEVYRALGATKEARAHFQAAVDLDWKGETGERARKVLADLGSR
jgi:tetratricopeptide (TPR) repeat protein